MINLRKTSNAVIADQSITKEKIADGAIDSTKIEDGAVNLTSAKVVGELPNNKLANDAVTATKIAVGAVGATKLADNAVDLTSAKVIGELPNNKLAVITDVNKMQDNLVTLAKVNDDVRLTSFVAGEEEQFVIGNIATPIVETGFSKVIDRFVPTKIRIIADLKIDVLSGNIGYLDIFVDEEPVGRLSLNSVSNEYTLVNGEFSVEDLPIGRHKLTAKMYNTLVLGKVYNDYFEVYMIK